LRTYENDKLGIGISSVLLISRWMSVNAMFTASLVTMTYGILAGVLFGIIGAITFSTFGFIGKKLQDNANVSSPIDLWKDKVGSGTIQAFYIITGIIYALDYLLLAIGASIIFFAAFHLPAKIGVLLFMVLGLPLLFFRPLQNIRRYTIYKYGLFQTILIVIFVYLFLSKNLEQMYFGIRLYHPYLFSIQLKELLLFIVAIFVIFLGKLLGDFGTWGLVFRIKKEKLRGSIIFAGLIWATIPIAFSIIIFPALGLGGFQNVRTVFYDLLRLFDSPLLLFLTTAIILGTLISTYFVRLQDFLHLLETKRFSKHKKNFYVLSVLTFVMMYGIYFYVEPDLLDLFFFIGILNASLVLPILVVVLTDQKHSKLLSTVTVLSLCTGYVSFMMFDHLFSVLITFLTSAVFLGFYYFFKGSAKHRC
jgi:hypothetical protein